MKKISKILIVTAIMFGGSDVFAKDNDLKLRRVESKNNFKILKVKFKASSIDYCLECNAPIGSGTVKCKRIKCPNEQ